jgi:hypothetical protein
MKLFRYNLIPTVATIATALAVMSPTRAQQPPHDHEHPGATPAAPANPAPSNGMPMQMDMRKGMPDCAAMMKMKQQAGADRKADDARLKDLTEKMNQATADQKADAMAAVINELVAQRMRRAAADEKMEGQMMEHMMAHMQHGGAAGAMQCPMMQMMAGNKAGSTGSKDAHAQHHP